MYAIINNNFLSLINCDISDKFYANSNSIDFKICEQFLNHQTTMILPLKVLMILKLFSSDLMISCIDSRINNDNKLPSRQINTKYGSLRGNLIKFPLSSKLPPIESYLGVPYATPPIGSLRFMPPVTPTHWKGVRSADKYSTVCPQKLPNGIDNPQEANKRMSPSKFDYLKRLVPLLKNQSEDCLYLNIWTPITAQQGNLLFT